MERLRKGNDIDILWEIVAGGSGSDIPYDLTGKNLEVFMSNTYEKVAIKDFKVEGNTLRWTYLGKDQQRRGIYSLLLIENNGKDGMHTVDECKAFELVDCSCMEGGEAESHVRIETIRLKSGISVNSIVPDKTLDANSGNVVENATIAKEFQRVDNDIKEVSDTVENQGRKIVNLGETLSEHGDALDVLNGEGEGSVKRTVADEMARIVADAPEGYDTLKEIADYIASDKTGAAQINNTLDAHGKAISAIEKKNTEQDTAIGKKAEQSALEGLEEIVSGKAEQDGVYPDMTVGLAEDLGGRPYYDEAEFSFRASAGSDTSIKDGMASIKELRGNSVVWNQQAQQYQPSFSSVGVTAAWVDGKIHIYGTINDENGDPNLYALITLKPLLGHKYAVIPQGAKKYTIYTYGSLSSELIGDGTIISVISNDNPGITLRPKSEYQKNGEVIDETIAPSFIDLTLMFGAGNEPVTIDEFYARMPIGVDMNAYNEGELIPFCGDAIKSVGDNAWDEEWRNGYYDSNGGYVYDATHICNVIPIRVLPGEQYYISSEFIYAYIWFYDQNHILKSHRSVYGTNGASITFDIPEGIEYINFNMQPEYGATYNNDIMISLVHSGWKQDTDAEYQPYWEDRLIFDQRIKDAFPNGMRKWDKVYNKNGKGYIVKGTETRAYQDGDAASDTMITDGKTTVLALATPEIIEYDEPFNLDYRVADFGTEEVISDQPSAPIAAEIQYNFNANDTIRTNRIAIRDMHREIAELRAMISAMQVQLTDKEDQV